MEVARGLGSVVYGTGAIAGVINIITKSANSQNLPRGMLNVSYHPDYRSQGFSYQFSRAFGELNTYFFGSYLKLAGLELEAVYKTLDVEVVANHSYIKPLEFSVSDQLKNGANRNNISYSDYYHFTRGTVPLLLEDYGNGINNWSENTSKLIVTKKWLNDKLALQINTQVYWDYRGGYDEMGMYQQAYDNVDTSSLTDTQLVAFEQQRAIYDRERRLLENKKAYQTQYNLGASIAYTKRLSKDKSLKTTLYAQNLLDTRYRYYVNTGSSNYYPNRLSFMEEPTIFWLKVEFTH